MLYYCIVVCFNGWLPSLWGASKVSTVHFPSSSVETSGTWSNQDVATHTRWNVICTHRLTGPGFQDLTTRGTNLFPLLIFAWTVCFFSSVSQVWFLPKGLGKSAIVQIPRWINSTAMFALDHGHLKLAIESETLCSEYLATIPTMWIHMWQCVRMYIWFSIGPPCKWGWVFCLAYGSPPMACGGGVFGMLVMRGQFCFLWFSPPVACGGGVYDVCNVM